MESKRVRGRFKSVFHGWLCCYGNKMWAPYSQKSVLLPSSLPSLFPFLCLHFISLPSSSRHPQHLHLSLSLSSSLYPDHIPPHASSLSLALILLSVIHLSPPTHSPLSLCPFPPLLHFSMFFLSVPLRSSLYLSFHPSFSLSL